MQAELTPLNGQKAIGITFTDKPVTAWGGLALFVAFAERIGLAAKLVLRDAYSGFRPLLLSLLYTTVPPLCPVASAWMPRRPCTM